MVNEKFVKTSKSLLTIVVATNEGKETKTYEEIWSKSRELIGFITKNSDDHDGKYMNIKCNWEDELPLN